MKRTALFLSGILITTATCAALKVGIWHPKPTPHDSLPQLVEIAKGPTNSAPMKVDPAAELARTFNAAIEAALVAGVEAGFNACEQHLDKDAVKALLLQGIRRHLPSVNINPREE